MWNVLFTLYRMSSFPPPPLFVLSLCSMWCVAVTWASAETFDGLGLVIPPVVCSEQPLQGDCLFDKWAGNAASIDQWAPRSWLGRVPPHSPSLYVVLQFIGLLASTQTQTRKHLASLKRWAKTHLCVITRCVSCCRGRCSYNVAILALGTQIFWWC